MSNCNRRKFIKNSLFSAGAAGISLDRIFDILSQGIINSAIANEVEADNLLNYVGIHLRGGPPRWLWDLPLHSNDSGDDQNNLTYNPSVITKFALEGQNLGIYESIIHNGIKLPSMWGSSVAVHGGTANMTTLADNGIFMRGILFPSGAHEGSWQNVMPFFGTPGVHTFPQGQNGFNRPFDCIQLSGNRKNTNHPYFPRGGGSSFDLAYPGVNYNPFKDIASPFNFKDFEEGFVPAGFMEGGNQEIKNRINTALDKLKAVSENINRKSGKLFVNLSNAKTQFMDSIDLLQVTYEETFEIYKNVIRSNITDNTIRVPGVEDVLIDNFSSARFADLNKYFSYENGKHVKVGGDGGISSLSDLFNANTQINSLAAGMALTEILLKNRLTSSVVFGVNSMDDLLNENRQKFKLNNDAHYVGAALSLIGFTKYYKCLSGCILTLKSRIGDFWENTIVHVHGDFNRVPRRDGDGSDHGPSGSNTSIFSGRINGAKMVGNIKVNSPADGQGDWGEAAYVNDENKEYINNQSIEKSFSELFSGAKSSSQAKAVLTMQGSEITISPEFSDVKINKRRVG